jgi:hypothetical protein
MKLRFVAIISLLSIVILATPFPVYAGTKCGGTTFHQVTTSIDIGCKGVGNPVSDMLFAFLRFLSVGVGLVIVGSLIWAGILYIFSRDDPGAVSTAKMRILHTIVALLIYIFAYAMLDFLIPGGLFT